MRKGRAFAWLLFGLGSQLQIVASLSFTELFVFAATPVLMLGELPHLRRNGMMTFLWLAFAVVAGCIIASIANGTAPIFVLRGMAVTTLLPCTIIVGHWMLRKDMGGFKWMLIGSALSNIFSTFIFQKSVEIHGIAGGVAGEDAIEAIVAGPIYWVSRMGELLTSLPKGWYLQCPLWISVAVPLFMAGFSMLTTVSGRSAALGAIGSAVLVLLGGKRQSRIYNAVCKRFWILVVVGAAGVATAKWVYSTSAEKGWLGEEARTKYEHQTKGDKSLKALLLGGRMESFCGLVACVDKPIIGFGPWAKDENGYIEEFLSKYANVEDYENYLKYVQRSSLSGSFERGLIPCHAFITEFWLWYGIAGLVFWIYVMFVLVRYLKEDCWAVPQWFLWLAASIPGYFWGVFFSPWSARVSGMFFVVACLMARAVRTGCQKLPESMLAEIDAANAR